MQFFFRNCTHILTRTQGQKFEDMFLVKIASKETFLKILFSNFLSKYRGIKGIWIKYRAL